ncbi:MAG TPA: inorganic pyrophosphatase, partial [Alphaproteobacteria bacterium]|nr:inorganic pyrophosphatase [Alphaproteobacteria bacterium]
IGGFELNDGGEADDKIIAVIENDHVWGNARSLSDVPAIHIERLQHYFLTYKLVPGKPNRIKIARFYNRAHALRVIRAAMRDYADTYSY